MNECIVCSLRVFYLLLHHRNTLVVFHELQLVFSAQCIQPKC